MQIGILAVTAGEVFTYIGYVIVALLALMLMIVVHELGHYTAGRLLGFKIDEFAIGFGPAIFKRNRGTVYNPTLSHRRLLFFSRRGRGRCLA